MPNSLEVFHDGQLVFSSQGSWLHPLFDLERVLASLPAAPSSLEVRDKIVGAASAFLIVSMGIKTLHAGLLSGSGEAVLRRFGLTFTYDRLVERIGCATEHLLDPAMAIGEAVALLRERARRGLLKPVRDGVAESG